MAYSWRPIIRQQSSVQTFTKDCFIICKVKLVDNKVVFITDAEGIVLTPSEQ